MLKNLGDLPKYQGSPTKAPTGAREAVIRREKTGEGEGKKKKIVHKT